MLKVLSLSLLFLTTLLTANTTHFASSKDCKSCHAQIYDEFYNSMHANATPQKDPIHNAIWSKHPLNKKMHKYGCGKCHTPTAPKMSMPTAQSELHQEGISCAYCHRIESIEHHQKSNTNITTTKEKVYFGTRKEHIDSPYHGIVTEGNEHMKNGNVCIGCHSHKMNKHKLNLCSTNIANEMDKANCVSCHMPKVKGSVSKLHETKTHAYHGFPGSHFDAKMLRKYVDIDAKKSTNGFDITVKNHTSHALLLHPLRVAVLKVKVKRGSQEISLPNKMFLRVIGHNKKPSMPWSATTTLKDTMLKASEQRTLHYDFTLQKDDTLDVTLGWFLVNPKAVKKLGLQDKEVATKFITFKRQLFQLP